MITDEEFHRIASYLKGRYGIDMSRKKIIMNGRLENFIRTEGFQNFNEYMDAIQNDFTGQLEKTLINLLTTNHTFFMREFEHMEFLKNVVLPQLKEKERRNKDLAIWCGASSTGEEPYMLAMVMKEFFGLDHPQWDTKILATDISTRVLKQAVDGIYEKEQLTSLPDSWKRRFFRPLPDSNLYMVTNELKREIIFRQFNLMEPFPFKRRMHIVFLRNVMIYFDEPTKRELIQKVYDVMEPGGYLFIGTTETIDKRSTNFQYVQPSIYRKE